jgi:hypothetical protein
MILTTTGAGKEKASERYKGTGKKVQMATEKQKRNGQERLPTVEKRAGADGTLAYTLRPLHQALSLRKGQTLA